MPSKQRSIVSARIGRELRELLASQNLAYGHAGVRSGIFVYQAHKRASKITISCHVGPLSAKQILPTPTFTTTTNGKENVYFDAAVERVRRLAVAWNSKNKWAVKIEALANRLDEDSLGVLCDDLEEHGISEDYAEMTVEQMQFVLNLVGTYIHHEEK